jgi:hypothetical protein
MDANINITSIRVKFNIAKASESTFMENQTKLKLNESLRRSRKKFYLLFGLTA